MVVFHKVFYKPPGGVKTLINDHVVSVKVARGLDAKANKATITLKNSVYNLKNSDGSTIFQTNGSFEIYVNNQPLTLSDDELLLSGTITEINGSTGSNDKFEVSLMDETATMLSMLWSKTYQDLKVDEIIRRIIIDSGSGLDVSGVVNTTSTGGSFPTISKSANFKSVWDWIKELSQPENTGEDRSMIFYVDQQKVFHWFYPPTTVSYTLTEGVDDIYKINLKKSASTGYNMIIFNAGTNLYGNGVLWYKRDTNSKSTTLKMKYVPMTDISKTFFDAEITAGNLYEDQENGTIPYKGKMYSAVTPGTTSWGESYSDLSEYNDVFVAKLKSEGESRCNKLFTGYTGLVWKGTLSLPGVHGYNPGDVINFTSKTLGIINKALRITDVNHSVGSDGWVVDLNVEEDPLITV